MRDQAVLRDQIENDMFYSRKYFFKEISHVVIPGVFPKFDKQNSQIYSFNPADQWKQQLGKDLYETIVESTSETDLEKNIKDYLDKIAPDSGEK